MRSFINRHRLLWRLPFVWPYGPHRLTVEDQPNLSTGAPGVSYSCSCGWSQGWVEACEGDLEATRMAVKRINRVAHQASKRTWR